MEQPLQNETSEDEIMDDQLGQNEFENSNEDQMIQEADPDYSIERDKSRSPRGRKRQEEQSNPENETITRRSTRATRGIKPKRFREM